MTISALSLLPNARAQFLDPNNVPLAYGTVETYIPGTSTLVDTYQDNLGVAKNKHPINLDAYGSCTIWAFGTIRQVVKDQAGNLIWDQITQANVIGPNFFPVEYFGGVGDDTTDNTAAIQAAALQGVVVFSSGTYYIASSLAIGAQCLFIDGASIRLATGQTVTFSEGLFSPPVAQIFQNATAGQGTVAFPQSVAPVAFPEWWGAVPNSPVVDCTPAINAAIVACPETQLHAGAYYVGSQINIGINGRTLRGVAPTQQPADLASGSGLGTVSTVCSQLIMTSPSALGIFVGYNVSSQPTQLLEFVTQEDFTLVRATATVPLGVSGAAPIANPVSGVLPCPTAITYKWCANCHTNRVVVIEHSIGFYLYGCVEMFWDNARALRYTAGANSGNDNFSGFYLDYTAPLGTIGGDASIYLNRCGAFTTTTLTETMTYASGITTIDGFVDLFVNQLETGNLQYGIDLVGAGYGDTSFRGEDAQVINCTLDASLIAGIRIRNSGPYSAVQISQGYCALTGTAGTAILLSQIAGAVAISNMQFVAAGNASAGVSAATVGAVTTINNIFNNIIAPINLNAVNNFSLDDTAHIVGTGTTTAAVVLVGCSRGKVEMGVFGTANGYNAGVNIDSTSSHIEVNCTKITPATVGAAANKIIYNGSPWGGGTTFGTDCIASGDLT